MSRKILVAQSAAPMSRRAMIAAGLGAAAALVALPGRGNAGAAPAKTKIVTYKSASCGCCGKWVAAARKAGFDVTEVAVPDIWAVKEKHGVPRELASCHTSIVGNYALEGHVPLDAVRRLIARKPAIAGIAVAGMPRGTPGMETPDGAIDPYQVMAFDKAGKTRPFA